jgi:hypothetical protein
MLLKLKTKCQYAVGKIPTAHFLWVPEYSGGAYFYQVSGGVFWAAEKTVGVTHHCNTKKDDTVTSQEGVAITAIICYYFNNVNLERVAANLGFCSKYEILDHKVLAI